MSQRLVAQAAIAFLLFCSCDRKSETKEQAAASAQAVSSVDPVIERVNGMQLVWDLGKPTDPEDNPTTDEKVKLGHQLFFDKRLSADGSRSCYSCHLNEDGNGGHEPLAIGAGDKKLTRHSPVIWNVGLLPRFYWDGRSESLEAQALAAWTGGNMGVKKEALPAKVKEIEKVEGYKQAFAKVFADEGVTADTIVKAISAYERTLICDNTAYDKFAKGDKKALSDAQKRGLDLFMGAAACVVCHAPPHFSTAYMGKEGAYFNVGVGVEGKPEEDVDIGRKKVSEQDQDWAAFKVPSLRNVAKSPPYFHDGSVAKLEDAVRFMVKGGFANKSRSALLTEKKLSDSQVEDLVMFLEALNCDQKLEEPTLP